MPFGGVDYFQMADLLSDEEKLVTATFRRFVDDEIMPVIGRHFRNGTVDSAWPRRLGALGALGANLVGYGCPGLDAVAYGLIMQELERGDSGIRSFASVQGALVMYPIHAFGSEEQKQRFLPKCATGEWSPAFALSEPGAALVVRAGRRPTLLRVTTAVLPAGERCGSTRSLVRP